MFYCCVVDHLSSIKCIAEVSVLYASVLLNTCKHRMHFFSKAVFDIAERERGRGRVGHGMSQTLICAPVELCRGGLTAVPLLHSSFISCVPTGAHFSEDSQKPDRRVTGFVFFSRSAAHAVVCF